MSCCYCEMKEGKREAEDMKRSFLEVSRSIYFVFQLLAEVRETIEVPGSGLLGRVWRRKAHLRPIRGVLGQSVGLEVTKRRLSPKIALQGEKGLETRGIQIGVVLITFTIHFQNAYWAFQNQTLVCMSLIFKVTPSPGGTLIICRKPGCVSYTSVERINTPNPAG